MSQYLRASGAPCPDRHAGATGGLSPYQTNVDGCENLSASRPSSRSWASARSFTRDHSARRTIPTGDPVVQRIYDEGMHRSQAARLAQVLMDSIGPRLTGSPANRAANDWLLRTYQAWGVDAKNEQYGTWRDWTRGTSGLELVAPRVRVLEATMHAWSASTPAGGVTADVVIIPTREGDRRQRRLRALARQRQGKARARRHAAADLPPRFRRSLLGRQRDLPTLRRAARQRDRRLECALHAPRTSAVARFPRYSSAPASLACSRTRGLAAGASTRSSRRE